MSTSWFSYLATTSKLTETQLRHTSTPLSNKNKGNEKMPKSTGLPPLQCSVHSHRVLSVRLNIQLWHPWLTTMCFKSWQCIWCQHSVNSFLIPVPIFSPLITELNAIMESNQNIDFHIWPYMAMSAVPDVVPVRTYYVGHFTSNSFISTLTKALCKRGALSKKIFSIFVLITRVKKNQLGWNWYH